MRTLKLVASIDGSETDVGRCHPGQARIMQKKGLAEFREGKLWLVQPDKGISITLPEGTDAVGVFTAVSDVLTDKYTSLKTAFADGFPMVVMEDGVVPSLPKLERHPVVLDDEALLEAGVEPGDWMDVVKERGRYGEVARDVHVHRVSDLLRIYLERIAVGHRCYAHDDIWNRHVGFIDQDANEFCYVTITELQEMRLYHVDVAPFGIPADEISEALKTVGGRINLFGMSDLGDVNTPPPDDDIEWGPVPEIDEKAHVSVGIHNLLNMDLPPPRTPDETVASRAERRRVTAAMSPVVVLSTPRWTHFTWPGAYDAIPVRAPGIDGKTSQFPPTAYVPEELLEDGVDPVSARPGVYRRVAGRLYRVWADGLGWDVSVLQDDNTYLLESQHRMEEEVAPVDGGIRYVDFKGQLAAAEEMITNPDLRTAARQK